MFLVDINLLIVRCLNVLSGINCEGVRKSLPVVDLTKVVETAQKTGAENTSEIMVLHIVCYLFIKLGRKRRCFAGVSCCPIVENEPDGVPVAGKIYRISSSLV